MIVGRATLIAWLLLGAAGSGLSAQADSASRAWNRPVAPFRILGNVYYVGATEVASYLIATSAGLIVLDGGFMETAPQILANIRTLGFDPRDVRILLNSHAHYDHAGGLAALKEATGAKIHAGQGDSALLARGGLGDFGFGDRFPYPPVSVDRAVGDGDRVILGGDTLVAIATPGHTLGCTTWATTVRDGGREYAALFICSLSIPGYRLRDAPPYPGIVRDYRTSIQRLQELPCELFLTPHGSQFGMLDKMRRAGAGGPGSPFIDPEGCRTYLEKASEALERRIAP